MPEEGVPLMEHGDILSYEEILRVVKASAKIGITKVRLTGGEPLLRKDICFLIKEIKNIDEIVDVSITTNGLLLEKLLEGLVEAGLDRINLSLDTINKATYEEITGRDGLDQVLRGLEGALHKGLKVKINAVPLKGYNSEELVDLAKLTEKWGIDVRFIELMPIGCGKNFEPIPNMEIIESLKTQGYNMTELTEKQGNGPAVYYRMDGAKGALGFISPISHAFCNQCNRIRLTAEGFLKLCLHAKSGIDLRDKLRSDMSEEALVKLLQDAICAKPEEHHFNEQNNNEDTRSMYQIGG